MIRNNLLIVVTLLILILSVTNALHDETENDSHEDFFVDVREFMNKGGRNTSSMGYQLCLRLNALELESGKSTTDCNTLYEGR